MATNPFCIIDGSSMLVRAYFATAANRIVHPNPDGIYTNAVSAFMNMLLGLLPTYQPSHLLVAWDVSRDTFRRTIYPAYKGTRGELPDEMVCQFSTTKDVLAALRVMQHQDEQYEADDIIGSAARLAEQAGHEVLIVTGDRDALQLITEKTTVAVMKSGTRDMMLFTPRTFEETYNIQTHQFVDLKALMGDTSDNIPGVKGIGVKTATSLLQAFGSLESLIESDATPKRRPHQLVQDAADIARLSKRLATIVCDVDLPFQPEECVFSLDVDAASEAFLQLHLRTALGTLQRVAREAI